MATKFDIDPMDQWEALILLGFLNRFLRVSAIKIGSHR